MQKTARLTARQRDRALGRLRTLTVGTAFASAAATGAFGYLAVTTNPGTQVTSDATVAAVPSTVSTGATGSTAAAATAAPTATPGLQSSTSGATTTTRRAHVTTGGS